MNIENIISTRALSIDGAAIREANSIASEISNPINLTIGQPDFDVNNKIKNSLIDAMNNRKNGYCKTIGIDELRKVIISQKKIREQDVIITSGVTGGISLSLLACLDIGDELLIPDPYFLQYAEIVKLLGITPIFIDTYPDFKISLDRIEEKITKKTKALILNSPNNPTGVSVENEELTKIITTLSNKGIVIIFDEIYSDFNYTDKKSINLFDYGENIILLNGYSKSYAMTGWRLGYAIAHPKIIERMTRIQGQLYVSPASIVQYAAVEAFNIDINPLVEVYKKRNILVKKNLSDNFNLSESNGGFYFFPEIPQHLNFSATDFCKLAAKNRVLLVPGKAFSQKDSHFRLSICVNDEKLLEGIKILNEIIRGNYDR